MVRYGYKCDVDYNILEICSNLLGVVVIYISLQKFLSKYSFHFRSMFNFYIPLKRHIGIKWVSNLKKIIRT